ncbi:unnamed protein product, partial [Choristocarpus tenellus]
SYAIKLNRDGIFFPVWGTCLGFEWIAQAVAGHDYVLKQGFDAMNMTQPLSLYQE